MAFDGDIHRKPGKPQHGSSAGTGFLEYIDARHEPVGWRSTGFVPGAGWGPAVATPPTAAERQSLHSKMEPPMQVYPVPVRSIRAVPPPPSPPTSPVACGIAAENSILLLGCPGGAAISGVAFAACGTPGGSCATNLTHSSKCDDGAKVAPLHTVTRRDSTCCHMPSHAVTHRYTPLRIEGGAARDEGVRWHNELCHQGRS